MGRVVGLIRNGKYYSVENLPGSINQEGRTANIIEDTMPALKHPVTEEVFESKSAYRRVNKILGLEEVGNDLLSNKKRKNPPVLTESQVLNAIQRAEAICSDPSKYRARQEQSEARFAQMEKYLGGK